MTRPQPTDAQIEDRFLKGKPGRKPAPAATQVPDVHPAALTEVSQAADQMAAVQAAYGQERDLLNQLLGQAQMADAFAKFSVTVTTSKLAFVKEKGFIKRSRGAKVVTVTS